MKRILLACFLLTATCTVTTVQQVRAQGIVHITATEFTTQVNQLDAYLAAGNITAAQSTWNVVHQMMISVLSYTKNSIRTAATPADKATYNAIAANQRNIYQTVWVLKSDLMTNRTALHTNLGTFDATIY